MDANPSLSPDERQVAVALRRASPENLDIWTIDAAPSLPSRPSRVTTDPQPEGWPVWSPDGTSIVFGIGAMGQGGLPEKARLVYRLWPTETRRRKRSSKPKGHLHGLVAHDNDTHADRLVRRRTFRVVHVRRVVSGDIGHLGPSTLWGSQTASSCTDRVFRGSRNVLPGRSMDRVYDRRDRPAKCLRSAISSRRWKASDFAEWRTESALAGRWQKVFDLDAAGAMTAVPIDYREFPVGLPRTIFPAEAVSLYNMYAVTRDGQRFLVNRPHKYCHRHAVDRHRQLDLDAPEIRDRDQVDDACGQPDDADSLPDADLLKGIIVVRSEHSNTRNRSMAARKSRSKATAARPTTVAAYLASLTPEKRAVIEEARAFVHKHIPRDTQSS